jgi:UDP-3-O-[3-hydroxymyristoyl] N-acetylglucosamine deacetylase
MGEGQEPLTRQVIIEGRGLHTGAPVRVVLEASPGPVRLRNDGIASPEAREVREARAARAAREAREARVDEMVVVSTERATTIEACGGGVRAQTVEHAFGALAGLGVYEGVTLAIDGPEMPLLDGGAVVWCDAVKRLGVARCVPRLKVAREATIEVGRSRYELATGTGVEVEVRLELDDARIARDARWSGDPDDFEARIASARTFAFAHEVEDLLCRGLARHVDPASVVVIAAEAIHCAGRPFSADEPARHKVLDLVGDLYLYGGPPVGRVRAVRPGHAANARAIRRACEEGALVRI